LAANIEDVFGVVPRLVEGHDGIYEVTVDGKVVFSNKGGCAGLPSDEEVLRGITAYLSPLPGKEIKEVTRIPTL